MSINVQRLDYDYETSNDDIPKPFPKGAKIFYCLVAIIAILIQWPQPQLDLEPYAPYMYDGRQSSLKGTTVVITGATSGIGRGMTLRLVDMGAHVIAMGRSASKLTSLEHDADGGALTTVVADMSDLDDVVKASKKISKTVKRIDFLINNAGIHPVSIPSDAKTKQDYSMSFGVNYLSHFLLAKKLLPLLQKSKHDSPRIIQVSSTYHLASDGSDLLAIDGKPPLASKTNFFGYQNTKLAQILHARALRRQPGMSKNIRVVSICPSWVGTQISGSRFGAYFMNLFGFEADGYGLAGLFHGMYHPGAGKDETTDYVSTNPVSEILSKMFSPVFKYKWMSTLYIRPVFCDVIGQVILVFQRFMYGTAFSRTSEEAYDLMLQDNLYEWSEDAVGSWMKK